MLIECGELNCCLSCSWICCCCLRRSSLGESMLIECGEFRSASPVPPAPALRALMKAKGE